MGNSQSFPWTRPMKPSDVNAMFHALDANGHGYLTLRDLMAASSPGIMMPHSLPALYFFDTNKDGMLTEPEFDALVHYCQTEKRKVEESLHHDKTFRNVILQASRAGVKDSSHHGRSSYRRFSSYSNVRSVFSSRSSHARTPSPYFPPQQTLSTSPTDSSGGVSSLSTSPPLSQNTPSSPNFSGIAMFSSQKEFENNTEPDCSDPDLNDPSNKTALDAAVIEKVNQANIHKLADLLHAEGTREEFMSWLWNASDFNNQGVVTLEELRVLLAALNEDGIYLNELAFYREIGVPLEESIINEFDTSHTGMLSRDEFMVLADLITREYEFWENRHLERIGDYELGRTIGRGSSGVVRLAINVETRQRFAIKIIKKGKCSDLSRLDREIQSLMAAEHKHIVALEEVLDSEANLFLVMELCGGGSMVDIVRLYPEERMPEETARFFMRQVFEALAFCHGKGICHRDVRLDNLMLDNEGVVKITDFGHSGIYTPGWDYFSTALVGSVYNLSPEQIHGQLYSGEKIDVWSAGVAVYCLLVGQPPFFEPEVNPLLESIVACTFELPDYLSDEAKDLIQCMVRANPNDRIPIQQMLHHPWFYNGPEFGPSMNVVVIPVDMFFMKRPDIAEMIMAITIYQHSLHFHLADTQNPNSSPEDQRGQDWTLKCLCPRNHIKFTVSLFTKKPQSPRKKIGMLTSPMSFSSLTNPALLRNTPRRELLRTPVPAPMREPGVGLRRMNSESGSAEKPFSSRPSCPVTAQPKLQDTGPSSSHVGFGMQARSASRPPLQRNRSRITPLRVAAHIRDAAASKRGIDDVFDFEPEEDHITNMPIVSFRDEILMGREKDDELLSRSKGPRNGETRSARHSRSHSLDEAGNLVRINRSATVDAFPYQKVYPRRKMPESVRNMSFESPVASSHQLSQHSDAQDESAAPTSGTPRTPQERSLHHSLSPQISPLNEPSSAAKSPSGTEIRISQELSRHPLKAVSPQSPQIVRSACVSPEGCPEPVEELSLAEAHPVTNRPQLTELDLPVPGRELATPPSNESMEEFEPYLEVRLQEGESGLFLKICRKLKKICTTKLATAAERQKCKTGSSGERRTLSALRRTVSAKNVGRAVLDQSS